MDKKSSKVKRRKMTDKGGDYLCPKDCTCGGDRRNHNEALSQNNLADALAEYLTLQK